MKSPFKFGDAASDIKDIKIHSDSIEIVFDVKLLAAEATIPPEDISYDKEKNRGSLFLTIAMRYLIQMKFHRILKSTRF